MKLVLFNQANSSFFKNVIDLGEQAISTVNGVIIMTESEREKVITYSRQVYQEVFKKANTNHFFGHIRVDLVPEISNFRKIENGYEWDLDIAGVYEINSNSPECGAATAALHSNFPKLAQRQPDPAKRIIKSLNGHINGEKVAFVVGKGAVKKEWGHFFMNSLKEKGLNIEKVDPEKAVNYDCVWRFGDVRFGSYSEFSDEFRELLIQKQQSDLVLNTVPESPRKDIGNKKFLLSENDRQLETEKDARWALKQDDMVLKPFRGTSGKGIYFQKNMPQYKWEEKVFDSVGKGYGLFKAKWLPLLDIEEVAKGIVMDLSPSFLARDEKLDYLYTISRIEKQAVYEKRSTINVAKGGGFVGTLLDNKN